MKGKDVPLFIGGDFNSEPNSSVMSVLHSEDIESNQSEWSIP